MRIPARRALKDGHFAVKAKEMHAEKKMIMIVDDDVELLEELSVLLSDNGFETITFTNGSSATKEAYDNEPDLILLDLKLGGKSGFLVATELTRLPKTAKIPILGITGYYNGKMYGDLMNIIGFRGCLLKPLEPEKLISSIREILEED
jgi:DNA-binding response OmpR family regulator